ncbi:hypothetical protein O181_082197 [Austropuccinia psidii MF-1]|uniref:Uncharacterized protein n=1 Tax=Austropuccinia psidii MF-1 TaxID=1389203 RepID=A0A9Q3FPZ6_9BASI|nr:hypothetical protein [Austropuccinia psidii MF-1]
MVPIQHINPLLFITDTLTESDTSAPNSDTPNLTSSSSGLGQCARSHVFEYGLYQTILSDNESLEEYDIGDEDYAVAEDDVTPPKQAQSLVKRRRVQSNFYDYFEVSNQNIVKVDHIHADALFLVMSSWQSSVAIHPTSTNTMVDVVGVSTHGLVKHPAWLIQTWVPSFQHKNKNPS